MAAGLHAIKDAALASAAADAAIAEKLGKSHPFRLSEMQIYTLSQ